MVNYVHIEVLKMASGPNPRPDQRRGKQKQGVTKKRKNKTGNLGGRPYNEVSNDVINEFIKVLYDKEQEHGTSWIEEFTSLMWGEDKSAKIRVGKELAKMFTVQHSSKDVNINETVGPSIGLPEANPDPAKVVNIK